MLSKEEKLEKKVKNLPTRPGIYKYKNSIGEIIYVGKAKSLRDRVKSYFQIALDSGSKTAVLVQNIVDLDFIETFSEFEALILEAELIRKYRPKYNISLKDDKSYLYIVIRSEKVELEGKKVDVPKILTARKPDLQKRDTIFGPFPNTETAKYLVRTIRKVFPYRDCSLAKFNRYKTLGRPCLYGHIGVCQAPCVGRISPENYKKEIKRVKKLLSGQGRGLLKSIERSMKSAAKKQNYEAAAYYRDILNRFNFVLNKSYEPESYIQNPYLVQDMREKSLSDLKQNIQILDNAPKKIECYDISTLSGKDAVGSMVVALNGVITKSEYKRFKIKTRRKRDRTDFDLPDDVWMMREVLTRRFKNDWPLPDLLVVDGGKAQVSTAIEAAHENGVVLPIIGLAKKFETIVYWSKGDFVEINLEPQNEGLKLLQRLRDEAHRFAQSYHHKLRLRRIREN